MRQAFVLLGIMTAIVYVGAFVAFHKKAEAPVITKEISMSLSLTSPAFKEGEKIPLQYSCDGENISVPLRIEGAPEGTKSFVLVMDDPDIPQSVKDEWKVERVDHWVVYNIPPETSDIAAGETVGILGKNTRGTIAYRGPCPPDREHRYFFRLYALSGTLNFIATPSLYDVEEAAKGMMIEQAALMGRYERILVPPTN
jgi:Raf kinase inhibitor-like YbhB/YbcL family protein